MTAAASLPRDPVGAEIDRACDRWDLEGRYRTLDRRPAFPWEEFGGLGSSRLLGLTIPRRWGGRGLPAARAAAALFRLAYRGGTAFAKLSLQPEFCSILAEHGSPQLRERWFRPLTEGRRLIGNQITEPSAGSDATALALEARASGPGYVLEGTKSEAAFAVDADAAIVYGREPGSVGAAGVSAFLVPQTRTGVRRRLAPPDLGERWQRRGSIRYDRVRVPSTDRIGRPGAAFQYLRRELVRDRGLLAAIYLGVARASWDETIGAVADRQAFGRPLAERQAVAFPLVDDGARLEACWLYTRDALARFDRGEDAGARTAMAKVLATETALTTLDHCIQFHGGSGYSSAQPHAQRWRDVRSGPIAHGPSEVLRGTAARALWPPPSPRSGASVPRSKPSPTSRARGR